MAIVYPTSLDSFSDKVDNIDDVQAVDMNDVQDAIEVLEAKVGVNNSVVVTSHVYLIAKLLANFAGASEPGTMYAGMIWADTTTHILKIRNEANNAWQSVWDLTNNKPIIANLSNEITNAMCAAALKDPAAGTAGLRTLGAGAVQAMPGNTDLNATAHTGDVTGTTALTIAAAIISQAKLKTSQGEVSQVGGDGISY